MVRGLATMQVRRRPPDPDHGRVLLAIAGLSMMLAAGTTRLIVRLLGR